MLMLQLGWVLKNWAALTQIYFFALFISKAMTLCYRLFELHPLLKAKCLSCLTIIIFIADTIAFDHA